MALGRRRCPLAARIILVALAPSSIFAASCQEEACHTIADTVRGEQGTAVLLQHKTHRSQPAVLDIEDDLDALKHIFPDVQDISCHVGSSCTAGGTPPSRGACVKLARGLAGRPNECWDICNLEHLPQDYTTGDRNFEVKLEEAVHSVRRGDYPHMRCPDPAQMLDKGTEAPSASEGEEARDTREVMDGVKDAEQAAEKARLLTSAAKRESAVLGDSGEDGSQEFAEVMRLVAAAEAEAAEKAQKASESLKKLSEIRKAKVAQEEVAVEAAEEEAAAKEVEAAVKAAAEANLEDEAQAAEAAANLGAAEESVDNEAANDEDSNGEPTTNMGDNEVPNTGNNDASENAEQATNMGNFNDEVVGNDANQNAEQATNMGNNEDQQNAEKATNMDNIANEIPKDTEQATNWSGNDLGNNEAVKNATNTDDSSATNWFGNSLGNNEAPQNATSMDNSPAVGGCCFSFGFGAKMEPCCLETEKADDRNLCPKLEDVAGSKSGFTSGDCPGTAAEAEVALRYMEELGMVPNDVPNDDAPNDDVSNAPSDMYAAPPDGITEPDLQTADVKEVIDVEEVIKDGADLDQLQEKIEADLAKAQQDASLKEEVAKSASKLAKKLKEQARANGNADNSTLKLEAKMSDIEAKDAAVNATEAILLVRKEVQLKRIVECKFAQNQSAVIKKDVDDFEKAIKQSNALGNLTWKANPILFAAAAARKRDAQVAGDVESNSRAALETAQTHTKAAEDLVTEAKSQASKARMAEEQEEDEEEEPEQGGSGVNDWAGSNLAGEDDSDGEEAVRQIVQAGSHSKLDKWGHGVSKTHLGDSGDNAKLGDASPQRSCLWMPEAGCVPKFIYQGVKYTGCASIGNKDEAWCSQDAVYVGRFKKCAQSCEDNS